MNINKKGQALVEFIIILPIFMIIIFSFIDLSRIVILKNNISNKLNNAVLLYNRGKTEKEIDKLINENDNKYSLSIVEKDDIATIKIKSSINPITPGFNYVPKSIFEIDDEMKTGIYEYEYDI